MYKHFIHSNNSNNNYSSHTFFKMTYRKITSELSEMSKAEYNLYCIKHFWNNCKSFKFDCACCQVLSLRILFNRSNFSRCYDCVCCKTQFPFLKNISIRPTIKWRMELLDGWYTKFIEYAENDIYESLTTQNYFILVKKYNTSEIPCSTKLYTEKEICEIADTIIDKKGQTYKKRCEKDKIYNLKLQIQLCNIFVSKPVYDTFNITGVVDNIASYMGYYLSLNNDCFIGFA